MNLVKIGENNNGKLDITNCYAIPFDEDPREPGVWFVDHNYHETMFSMIRKVSKTL
jgi:26S proteasome regulatory subunit N8